MKRMKKIFAVILSLAMVLGMSMTTFAAGRNVVVKDLKNGTKVSYVKIMEPDNASPKGWKMSTNTNIGMTLDQILAVTNKGTDGKINDGLTGLDFSELETDSVEKSAVDNKVTFPNMEPGLYAIKANDPSNEYVYSWMVAYVGFDESTADIEVTAKGASNQVAKAITDSNDKSVAAGEEIKYTVSVKYPFFAEDKTNKGFTITDTLTNGTFVSIESESRTALETLGFTVPTDAELLNKTTMTITLNMDQYEEDKAGSEVSFTYTVKADNDISSTDDDEGKLTNEVSSKVQTGKTEDDEPIETETKSKVILPTFNANVKKTDKNGNVIDDSTATFQLYVEDENGTEMDVYDKEASESKGKKTLKAVGNAVTTVGGIATFKGLDAESHYYVKETVAPDGYALEALAYPLTGAEINENPTIQDPKEENNNTKIITYTVKKQFESVGFEADSLNFHDSKVGSLPSTGGIGTTIFTIGGCAIMIIAAALFFASRRKSAK